MAWGLAIPAGWPAGGVPVACPVPAGPLGKGRPFTWPAGTGQADLEGRSPACLVPG